MNPAVQNLEGAPAPPAPRAERYEQCTNLAGWLLMGLALGQLVLRGDPLLHREHLGAAMLIAFVVVAFLFLLRPRLGSYHEWKGAVSALVVFTTCAVGFTHVLANQGDWPVARLYALLQTSAGNFLSAFMGEELAKFSTSPLYLFCAAVLLISFAYQSYKGFLLVVAALLLYGLYPWDLGIATGYLLWFAGFCLISREVLYLPRAIEERLPMDAGMRDLLLEARRRTLYEHEVLFFLGGHAPAGPAFQQAAADRQLKQLAGAGLLEYHAETKKIYPAPLLMDSFAPEGLPPVVNALSGLAAYVLLGLSLLYLAMPVDFLPEALLGPVGLIDDLVLCTLGAIPAGGRAWGAVTGRGKESPLPPARKGRTF